MNPLLEPFAKSLRQGPAFASVVLDDLLRKADMTWEGKTEDALIQTMRQAASTDRKGYAQGTIQIYRRMGEVDQIGTLTIDLVVVQGGAIRLSSTEFGEVLELPPFWLMIGTGQPCMVEIQGVPQGWAPAGFGYGPAPRREGMFNPGALLAAMLLVSALERQRRLEARRRMLVRALLFEAVQIGFVVLMAVLGIIFKVPALIIFFIGMYISTWMNPGRFRRLWIAAILIGTLYAVVFH